METGISLVASWLYCCPPSPTPPTLPSPYSSSPSFTILPRPTQSKIKHFAMHYARLRQRRARRSQINSSNSSPLFLPPLPPHRYDITRIINEATPAILTSLRILSPASCLPRRILVIINRRCCSKKESNLVRGLHTNSWGKPQQQQHESCVTMCVAILLRVCACACVCVCLRLMSRYTLICHLPFAISSHASFILIVLSQRRQNDLIKRNFAFESFGTQKFLMTFQTSCCV